MKMNTLDMIVWALVVIAALNWGLVGAFDFNLVESVFGTGTFTQIFYIAVGLAAVWSLVSMFTKTGSDQQM